MGTLASQAEICVWVQAPGTLLRGSGGITRGKILRLYNEKYCNLVHLAVKWFAMPSIGLMRS